MDVAEDRTFDFSVEVNSSIPSSSPQISTPNPSINNTVIFPESHLSPISRNSIASPHHRFPPPPLVEDIQNSLISPPRTSTSNLLELIPL